MRLIETIRNDLLKVQTEINIVERRKKFLIAELEEARKAMS